jgi:L-2,4-diaminobutyrate decarboxylase
MTLFSDPHAQAEQLRSVGHQWIDRLADYLVQLADAPDQTKVVPRELPAPFRDASEPLAAGGAQPAIERFAQLIESLLAGSTALHHRGFAGHQVTAPLPIAALTELAAALLNNGMAVREMGPAGTVIEERLVRFWSRRFGLPDQSDGVLTSGGSIGNLTALLAMRQNQADYDVWTEGARDDRRFAVLVSDQAHYSIARAASIMGWGAGGAVRVPTDGQFRLDPLALERCGESARRQGRIVLGVVANACSTATGSFDPLQPIAAYCAQHRLWLHVDAAHGGAAILSRRHRERLAGIEQADSILLDFHKMLRMPALASLVLFRDRACGAQAFAQRASYLFDSNAASPELAERTMECTKRLIGLSLYAALHAFGVEPFEQYLDGCFELTQRFAELIRAAPEFELATQPTANIICFRHRPEGRSDLELDAHQAALRQALLADGSFYLVQTRLPAGLFLRATLINPYTSPADLERLLARLRQLGSALSRSERPG